MSNITITLLPDQPVTKLEFQHFLIGKQVQIFDYKLSDFDPNSGSTLTPLGNPIQINNINIFPSPPKDVYLNLVFENIQVSTPDILVKLIDPLHPDKPIIEQILNYQFIVESNNSGPNAEPSKHANGYIFISVGRGRYSSLFKPDGTPPPYEDLEQALSDVITSELDNQSTSIKDLNQAQCLHLAREIVWRHFPTRPPRPEGKIKKIYEFEEGDEGEIAESGDDSRQQKRVGFEAEVKKFYSDGEKESRRLATYIFAFSGALWAENESQGASNILFRFPIQLPNVGSEEINIINLPSNTVGVPAEYFYVHGVNFPVEISKEDRYEQIKSEASDILLNIIKNANEQGIAALDDIEIPGHPLNLHYSFPQIIRLLRSQDTNRPDLPVIDATANSDLQKLIQLWAKCPEETSPEFWDRLTNGTLNGFTAALHNSAREGHSDLVIFLLCRGNATLISILDSIATNNLAPLVSASSTNWTAWYQQAFPSEGSDAAIDFLPQGTTAERAGYFAIYAAKFFGSVSTDIEDFSVDVNIHTPPVFSAESGVIQQFIAAIGSLDALGTPETVDAAILTIFPNDVCAQEWLREKVALLSGLNQITAGITGPWFTDELRLSVWEQLYALGFTEKSQIQAMSLNDFLLCVKGTILDGPREYFYYYQDDDTEKVTEGKETKEIGYLIHGGADIPVEPVENIFAPVNPGDLVNCIPPCNLATTGRYTYLQEMLAFKLGGKTVSQLLKETRQLSFDNLLVSQANAEVSIPRIDVVNGLLEAVVCKMSTSSQPWEKETFLQRFCAIRSFKERSEIQFADNELSAIILQFWEEIDKATDLKTETDKICSLFKVAANTGKLNGSKDATSILKDLKTNHTAKTLLFFIEAMEAMEAMLFRVESAQIMSALDKPNSDVLTRFTAFMVQSMHPYIGIGNTKADISENAQKEESNCCGPSGKTNDTGTLQDTELYGAPCAYEYLSTSTQNPCKLPFHRPRLVSETYLSALGTTRYELARKFSQHIHGFAYDPGHAPESFKKHLYRYPVNRELALEYLGISPQEYALFFEKVPLGNGETFTFPKLLGYNNEDDLAQYSRLDEFLSRNCLECCDLECWLKAQVIPLRIIDKDNKEVSFTCHDCESTHYRIDVQEGNGGKTLKYARLWHLTMLIRLARQLKKAGISCYSCADLKRISEQQRWISYDEDGENATIDSGFPEQFVALDMLRSTFGICLKVEADTDMPVLLTDLLVGPTGKNWNIVLTHFVEKIVTKCNGCQNTVPHRSPQFIKLLVEHIDTLALMAGFRSDADDFYKWYRQFTNVIRFAQVLQRVCDSAFTVGQLQFIFTVDTKLAGDDPYPLQTQNEAQEFPFNLPDNTGDFDLEALREKLLDVQIDAAELEAWTWSAISAHLNADFGYADNALLAMAKQFFPNTMSALGYSVSGTDTQFQAALNETDTAQLMWNTGNVHPFFYIPGSLTCKIPLKTAEVVQKLQTIRQLNDEEAKAVQNLFFAPRLALAPFAAFFENFSEAVSVLTESDDETTRWAYFRQSFALFYKKCDIITQHFTDQVADALGMPQLDKRLTWKIFSHLFADDHPANQPWEIDAGTPPVMAFPGSIHAGAFAALTKLTGVGLAATFKNKKGEIIWRDVQREMTAYGKVENLNHSPVPTVIPNPGFTPANAPLIAVVRNGNAHTNGSPSKLLGGAQGHTAEYKGMLYVTESGKHTFRAGAPTGPGEIPDYHQAKHSRWQLTLKRGSKFWIVLDNDWNSPDTPAECSVDMHLKKGAYEICFLFDQPEPLLHNMTDGCPQHTGWQIKWTTPYQSEWQTISIHHLYHQAPFGDLSEGVQKLHPTATEYLKVQYQPGITGMRHTALRGFAGCLLLHGSRISAEPVSDSGMAEIDYLLAHPQWFEGCSYYKDAGNWQVHRAGFNLNFLPVLDNYYDAELPPDQRTHPGISRVQAMFQWFEKLWEINRLKKEAVSENLADVWQLWHECNEKHYDVGGHLQKYLGVGFDKTHLVTCYHTGHTLTGADFLQEEWTIRAWEIMEYLKAWKCHVSPQSWKDIYPSEWVKANFNSSGNANLADFVARSLAGQVFNPKERLRIINDRIRTESRLALTALFEGLSAGTSFSLDDVLLLDASVGICEESSRLDIAIEMVQTFLNRISLGIENFGENDGNRRFSNKEAMLWNKRYASYKSWKTCKQRDAYPENFVLHDAIKEDSKSAGFRFLKEELKKDVLTMPVSGGINNVSGTKPISLSTLMPLQEKMPVTISLTHPVTGFSVTSGAKNLESTNAPGRLNFWAETAERLQIPNLRVAAAGLPWAEIQYGCKDTSCCVHCTDTHYYPVTEYYFWLVESRHYDEIKQTYKDWERDAGNNIEELLYMKDKAVYFLAWSKIENGRAGAVQWSATGIKTAGAQVELAFQGRFGDCLWLKAINGITDLVPLENPNPVPGTSLPPGFRFDLATEQVVTLPVIGEILPSSEGSSNNPFYFLYHDPGAPRFPKELHATVYLIARQLQSNCEYKGAKEWLDHVLHTLNRDNRWINATNAAGSKRKALLMTYLENLLAWSKNLYRHNTRESLNKAKMILGLVEKILGERPKQATAGYPDQVDLANFIPMHPGINPGLLCLYDEYKSQVAFLEHCLNYQGKNCYSLSEDISGHACSTQHCCDPVKDCVPDSPYRFVSLIGRAKEYANTLSALGNALQSAIEKGDQEKMTFLREVQSNLLVQSNRDMKLNLFREAYFQVEALEKTLEITEARLMHYQHLINVGLIAQEQDYITLTNRSMIAQAASQALHATSQFLYLLPENFIGSFSGSDVGGGTKAAQSIQGAASVASAIAGIFQTRAGLKNYDAGNIRREQEWIFQRDTLTIEVEQIKNQIVAAKLRLLNAQIDADNYEIQIDHSNQTLKYLRDKFTDQELYEWQERELSQLYYQLFECAMQVAFQAEKAYSVERCYSNEQFLNHIVWNNAYKGLMVGEHLSAALRNMEKKFMDTNQKRYELTKAISLRQEAPRSFLMIKYNGTSLIQVSEDFFAFNHPSHYCRMYKSISITIPGVTGPYENVNATLALRRSFVRVSPRILPSNCAEKKYRDGYRMRSNDDRFVYVPGGKDTLATSKALQDSGYHQLSFQDERNLTFEHAGIDAEFCFSLKQSHNRFDTGTISDIILETSYTAKEGGEIYGAAAAEAVKYRLPGNGELLINMGEQFPDAWFELQSGKEKRYRLELGRQDFPFLSFDAELFICQIEWIIEPADCLHCDVLEVIYEDGNCSDCDDISIVCQRSEALGGKVFHGGFMQEFPVSKERRCLGDFKFPGHVNIKNLYMLVTYKAVPIHCEKHNAHCSCGCH